MKQILEILSNCWQVFTDVASNSFQNNTFCTVISGVLVFVGSQLVNEYWLKPIQKYKALRAKISYSLTLYANLYMNPVEYKLANEREEIDVASNELRQLAAEVDAMIELKPKFGFLIASKKVLDGVSNNLIGLSNNLYSPHPDIAIEHNEERCREIYRLLKMKNKT